MSTTRPQRRRRSSVTLSALFLLTLVAVSPVAADSTAQTPPFSQDWHDTTLISVTDDWSGVPAIVGYLGQDIATTTGVDPQTLLLDSTVANDVDVIANIPPDVNIQNGGVGEFELDDAVVALQPDGIADAPYLLINLRTTGFRNVAVSYVLRDIDYSADDAVQPIALHYRVGSSGAWTNVPAGFVADATTGPLLATKVTPKNVAIPSAANDRALVQVRIITANAVPRDEWVGIDDIEVAASAIDQPPTVQSTSPGDGADDVARDANLSVTFDEPVDVNGGWFDISCATSQGHSGTVTGGQLTFSIDPDADFAYDETCTFTVSAQNVTDQDTNDPPNLMAADHVATFQTVAAPPEPPKPPMVDAGGPYDVVEGDSVVVSATGSQPDGQALTYRWDLDDDGSFETPGQSVTFPAAGLNGPVTRTIAVQATAPTGLTATDETTVDVSAVDDGFAFSGFKGLEDIPNVNETHLGTQILRFSLGGAHGLDIFQNGSPASASYACGTTPPTDASEPAQLRGSNGFKYDAGTDAYSFKWNIDKSWKNTCRVFVLGLADGSTHNVAFRFR